MRAETFRSVRPGDDWQGDMERRLSAVEDRGEMLAPRLGAVEGTLAAVTARVAALDQAVATGAYMWCGVCGYLVASRATCNTMCLLYSFSVTTGVGGSDGQRAPVLAMTSPPEQTELITALAAQTTALQSALVALARNSAGMAGLPHERAEQLLVHASTAPDAASVGDSVRAALTSKSISTGADGGGGGDDGSALAAAQASLASVSDAVRCARRLVDASHSFARTKADSADIVSLRRAVQSAGEEAARARRDLDAAAEHNKEQIASVLSLSLSAAPTGVGGAGGGGVDSAAVDALKAELDALTAELRSRATLEDLSTKAGLEDLQAKADRYELEELHRIIRHLMTATAGVSRCCCSGYLFVCRYVTCPLTLPFLQSSRSTENAFLAGKPLRDYRCLSCGSAIPELAPGPRTMVVNSESFFDSLCLSHVCVCDCRYVRRSFSLHFASFFSSAEYLPTSPPPSQARVFSRHGSPDAMSAHAAARAAGTVLPNGQVLSRCVSFAMGGFFGCGWW